jgi:transposase
MLNLIIRNADLLSLFDGQQRVPMPLEFVWNRQVFIQYRSLWYCMKKNLLTQEVTRENNRREAALILGDIGKVVANDTAVSVRHLKRRITILESTVRRLIKQSTPFREKLDLICSVTGIAHKKGPRILAELMTLPGDMAAKQWVAYAGLDPKPKESGSTIKGPRRISKAGNRYLRNALFFPALVAVQRDPNVRAFYLKLTQAGKRPKQAIVAVMRKLLLAIWGMIKHQTSWDGNKFYLIPN